MVRPIDLQDPGPNTGSGETPFSRFLQALVCGDVAGAGALLTDDIEWGLMPYNKVLKGKDEVLPWLQAATKDQKRPQVISDAATETWGVFEYWNVGTVSEDVIRLGNDRHWPWPKDPGGFLGQPYRVAQCFTYHITADRRIDFMRLYLDTSSVWAQLK